MILDNERERENAKVHEWISRYTEAGKLSVVTGYFTVGALAYISKVGQDKIDEFKFILGDLVNMDQSKDRSLDLLNDNISVEAALKLSQVAREAVSFLELESVKTKTLEPNFCHAKVYLFRDANNDPQRKFYITGSSNLTEAGLGLKSAHNVELNLASFGSDSQYDELITWFDNLWKRDQAKSFKTIVDENGSTREIPFKQYLIDEIKKIFTEYSPKQLYYKVLFELFGDELLDENGNPELTKQIGRLENTVIYNSLYEFQQKGVLSLIKMLQKYNGAILADAVGLGKTWTALAVMKFYQLQGREVILLCPKKLQNNWRNYHKNQNSKFEKDKLEFFLRFHTDLNDQLLDKYTDTGDTFFISEKPRLFVIDESHNLRNDKSRRYQFLLDDILRKNSDAKILMLSATPINNSLSDIRNQFKLIVSGNINGFEDTLDVKNLDSTFRLAQKAFNEWINEPRPIIGDFIRKLPANFFKLTDALIVARTRKMIEGHQDGLVFPEKTKPENIFVTPRQIGNLESFKELTDQFPPMLSGYQPSFYVAEMEKPDTPLRDERQRDRFLVKMMYILLVKRLESSWLSFQSTVEKILQHHQNALDRIIQFEQSTEELELDFEIDVFSDDDDLADDLADKLAAFTLGKKRKTSILDIHRAGNIDNYKKDLKEDIDALSLLQTHLKMFEGKINKEIQKKNNHSSHDQKLEKLIDRINSKRGSGENNGNIKVLIFTVYKDTAYYLLDQLKARGFENLAAVTGDSSRVWNEETESKQPKQFENILERFAPFTKLFKEKEWKFEPSAQTLSPIEEFKEWKKWIAQNDSKTHNKISNPIDILIASDALSEGQNLQDCDLVINYDIHWNPVRLIQRIGRIDRLGSPNSVIFGINFWPSDSINEYLNLQSRIETKMAQMKLTGAQVPQLTDSLDEMTADEQLDQNQEARMLRQMQSTWDEIDSEKTLGFDDFSLETFRQELLEELKNNQRFYNGLPNGIYTGFNGKGEICPEKGMIALLGFPARPSGAEGFTYRDHELIYINLKGKALLLNDKEVLDALAKHKEEIRFVPKAVDQGEPDSIKELSDALDTWFNTQAGGPATQAVLEKLIGGSKTVIQEIKTDGAPSKKYRKENFDLVTWFIVS